MYVFYFRKIMLFRLHKASLFPLKQCVGDNLSANGCYKNSKMALKAETPHHSTCIHVLLLARSPVHVCSLKQKNVQNCNYHEFIWMKITSQNFFHLKCRKVSLPPLKSKSKLKVRGFRTQVLSFTLLSTGVLIGPSVLQTSPNPFIISAMFA